MLWLCLTLLADPGAMASVRLQRALEAESDPARAQALVDLLAILPRRADQMGSASEAIRRRRAELGTARLQVRTRVEADWIWVRTVDPTDRVDRVEAVYQLGGTDRFLRPGRWEGGALGFRRPEAWPGTGQVVVRVRSTLLSPPVSLLEQAVFPAQQPPLPPEAPAVATPSAEGPELAAARKTLPWWVWTVGSAAAAGVALGVWQETR